VAMTDDTGTRAGVRSINIGLQHASNMQHCSSATDTLIRWMAGFNAILRIVVIHNKLGWIFAGRRSPLAAFAVAMCLSVCLSVTLMYCAQTNESIVMRPCLIVAQPF